MFRSETTETTEEADQITSGINATTAIGKVTVKIEKFCGSSLKSGFGLGVLGKISGLMKSSRSHDVNFHFQDSFKSL